MKFFVDEMPDSGYQCPFFKAGKCYDIAFSGTARYMCPLFMENGQRTSNHAEKCHRLMEIPKKIKRGARPQEGKWLRTEYQGISYAKCSKCGTERQISHTWTFDDVNRYKHYCENCGAKMN